MKNKHKINLIIIFILAAIVYQGVFMPGVAVRTDLFLPTSEWLKENSQPHLWTFEGGGKTLAPYELHLFPLYWLWNTLAQKCNLPIDLGRRIIWIYIFLAVGITSMYYLAWYISRSYTAAYISALYFILAIMNIWAIHVSWIQGPAALAFVPLSFVLFLKSLSEDKKSGRLIYALSSGVVLTVIVWYELKVTLLYIASLLAYYIIYVYKFRNKARKTTVSFLSVLSVPFLLNIWIILPYVFSRLMIVPEGSNQLGFIVSQENFYSLNLILKSFVENNYIFFPFTALISCLLFFPLLSSSRFYVIYFSFLTLFLIILSSGGVGPLGFIYSLFFKYIPFFVAFRDVNKFLLFLTFPSAILLGLAAKEAEFKFAGKILPRFRFPAIVITVIFSCIILFVDFPAFFGKLSLSQDKPGSVLSPKPISKEMSFLYKWVKTLPKDYKLLLYPGASPYSISDSRHPSLGALYYTFYPFKNLALYFWMNPYNHSSVTKRGLTGNLKEMLELLNIKYIVLYPENEYMWGVIPGDRTQEEANKILFGQDNFTRVKSPDSLIIYENNNPQPLIYPVSNINLVVGGRSIFLPLLLFNFDFSDNCLLFNSQLRKKTLELLPELNSVIFYGKDMDDLVLSTLEDKYKIDLWNYAKFSNSQCPTEKLPYNFWNKADKDWLRYYSPYWINSEGEIQEGGGGGLVQAGFASAELYLNYQITKDDLYEIWARAGLGHDLWQTDAGNKGEISFYLDYVLLGALDTNVKNITGLKWSKIGESFLKKGEHNIWIRNHSGINSIDQLIVVPKGILSSHSEKLLTLLNHKNIIFMFEGERNFVSRDKSKWKIEFFKGKASQGFILATNSKNGSISLEDKINNNAYSPLLLPHEGEYSIRLRIINYDKIQITIKIDGKNIYSSGIKPHREFIWLEVPAVNLSRGAHNLVIEKKGNGLFGLDAALIYSKQNKSEAIFSDNLKDKTTAPFLTKLKSPTEIEIQPDKNDRFIIFNTNYNPYWKLEVPQGKRINSIITNNWANGFFLKDFNNKKIKLRFVLQRYCDVGQRISALIFILTVAFVSVYFLSQYFIKRKRG